MSEITLTLDDELFAKLQKSAALVGMSVEEFLATQIHRHDAQLLQDTPKQWMPREQWDALVSGETCPMCAGIRTTERVDQYGYTIADLQVSRLRLGANQFIPGYCVLISKIHVSEVYHLSREDQARYFEDVVHAGQAIEQALHPIKMNFEILGNAIPHLHCHIIPRYYGDAAPGAPLSPDQETHILSSEEYEERVRLIREALDHVSQAEKGENL